VGIEKLVIYKNKDMFISINVKNLVFIKEKKLSKTNGKFPYTILFSSVMIS